MVNKVTPIGDIVKSVFTRIEGEKGLGRESIDDLWKGAAGEAAFKHSRPSSLRKKVLNVRVDSSGWMQELSMRKRRLLKALKRQLGKDRISELHFKIGEF